MMPFSANESARISIITWVIILKTIITNNPPHAIYPYMTNVNSAMVQIGDKAKVIQIDDWCVLLLHFPKKDKLKVLKNSSQLILVVMLL